MTPRAPAMAADERRASIIEATLPLLRDRGRSVSTREISKAAGIAEGTIFRVFDSKDDLITACMHEAFDTRRVRRELQAIGLDRPLAERLTAAVEVMQDHLKGVFSLMMTLQASGQPMPRPPHHDEEGHDPRAHDPRVHDRLRRERQRSTEELDADFEALIAPDRDLLRMAPETVVSYLRMLVLASVHPFMDARSSSPAELVDLVLEGALRRSPHIPVTTPAHPLSRGKI